MPPLLAAASSRLSFDPPIPSIRLSLLRALPYFTYSSTLYTHCRHVQYVHASRASGKGSGEAQTIVRGPGLWYMHDGAPTHFVHNVREHLNTVFGQRWIGRGGPVAWPSRSPDSP